MSFEYRKRPEWSNAYYRADIRYPTQQRLRLLFPLPPLGRGSWNRIYWRTEIMELKETEKKCFELLMKWGGDRVVEETTLMEELQADVETCKRLGGKKKEM